LNLDCVQTLLACDLANITSLLGSIHAARAKSVDNSIYNMFRLTTEKNPRVMLEHLGEKKLSE